MSVIHRIVFYECVSISTWVRYENHRSVAIQINRLTNTLECYISLPPYFLCIPVNQAPSSWYDHDFFRHISSLELLHTETAGDSSAPRASETKGVSVAIWRIRMVFATRATWYCSPMGAMGTERHLCTASAVCHYLRYFRFLRWFDFPRYFCDFRFLCFFRYLFLLRPGDKLSGCMLLY